MSFQTVVMIRRSFSVILSETTDMGFVLGPGSIIIKHTSTIRPCSSDLQSNSPNRIDTRKSNKFGLKRGYNCRSAINVNVGFIITIVPSPVYVPMGLTRCRPSISCMTSWVITVLIKC